MRLLWAKPLPSSLTLQVNSLRAAANLATIFQAPQYPQVEGAGLSGRDTGKGEERGMEEGKREEWWEQCRRDFLWETESYR